MFKQLINIESAFKHIRLFSLAFLLGNCIITCYTVYQCSKALSRVQNKIHVLANGRLLEATAFDRSETVSVIIRALVNQFHQYFYTLQPDEQFNKKHLTKAMYLCDETAKTEYDNLNESGYYSNILSGNITQQLEPDSTVIDLNQRPYYFKFYATLKITRPTSIATRSLVTEGYIRELNFVSDNNPFGNLVEHWRVLANKDLTVEKR